MVNKATEFNAALAAFIVALLSYETDRLALAGVWAVIALVQSLVLIFGEGK